MSHTKDRKSGFTRGFSLLELMMVTAISAFVFAGVLSAYIFLGRGLARQANAEMLESRTRTALYYFTMDVSSATAFTTSTATQLAMTTAPDGNTVMYTYDSEQGTLARTGGLGPSSLLTGITSFTFLYRDISGNLSPVTSLVKQVEMVYTVTSGIAVTGASSSLAVSSPWVIAKNKPSVLQ